MAGIYVHIPFCRQACSYCDFHFTIYFGYVKHTIEAILLETKHKINYLTDEPINTIYFGGGTPSAIPEDAIEKIISGIMKIYQVSNNPEITLEVNPDDINPEKIRSYRRIGVNRISIGVQSFRDPDLRLLNRRHNSQSAVNAITNTLKGGISNVSIDLIYGIPGLSNDYWIDNLNKAFDKDICHLSAYHLTYEPGTELYHRLMKKRIIQLPEQDSLEQFNLLLTHAEKAGFFQYEISNFARNDQISRHNTGYWTGKKYIGLGPSAHSYNGSERQWNIKGIMTYCKKVKEGKGYFEKEVLDEKMMYNEYIMTSLRTCWGVETGKVRSGYGRKYYDDLLRKTEKYILNNTMIFDEDRLYLSRNGMFIADTIIRDLFIS